MTEDEMAGWHHWLDGCESEWTPVVGDGQGGLECCDSWGRKESDMTEWLIWSDLIWCRSRHFFWVENLTTCCINVKISRGTYEIWKIWSSLWCKAVSKTNILGEIQPYEGPCEPVSPADAYQKVDWNSFYLQVEINTSWPWAFSPLLLWNMKSIEKGPCSFDHFHSISFSTVSLFLPADITNLIVLGNWLKKLFKYLKEECWFLFSKHINN